MPKFVVVTPGCCDECEVDPAVFLRCNDDGKPEWVSLAPSSKYGFDIHGQVTVNFCPNCGNLLPKIIEAFKQPTNIWTDDDDYCGTCHKRNMTCECYSPEIKFLPYKYYKDFGDDKLCKCGHEYRRHFDTYENMYACGCKYCECRVFQQA